MAGAGAAAHAAHAGAHAHAAAVRLRALCASAAAGIRDECDLVLRRALALDLAAVEEGNNSRRGGGGEEEEDDCAAAGGVVVVMGVDGAAAAAGDRDQSSSSSSTTATRTRGAAANGDGAGLGLADCGEPLVHLLSRQASRLVTLYEAAAPSYPPITSPVPVGPASAAEGDGQQPNNATRPSAHGTRQLRGGGHNNDTACGGAVGHHHLMLKRLDDIISIAYAKFYAYLYKDLPLCWRQLYTDASILKFGYLFLSSPQQIWGPERDGVEVVARPGQDATDAAEQSIQAMVKTLDLALILAGAGGLSRGRKWIDSAFGLFESVCEPTNVGDTITTAAIYGSSYGLPAMTAASNITPPPAKRARLDSSARTAAPGQASSRSFSTFEPFTPPVRNAIRRVSAEAMDMAAFQQYLDRADPRRGPEPLILTGLTEDWPARGPRPWNKPEYLLSRTFGGRRLVPVEIGRSYVDEGWGQRIVTFGEFLRNHIDPTSVTAPHQGAPAPTGQDQERRRTHAAAGQEAGDRSDTPHAAAPPDTANHPTAETAAAAPPQPPTPAAQAAVAYLAQHQLFTQLPQLRNDILVPDHCYTAPPPHPTDRTQDQPELDAPLLNAWLGPPGTITPLHTDPYHNLLAQVVGRKYVRLYSPLVGGDGGGADGGSGNGDIMRARGREGGVEMGNTSAWDVGVLEGWDADPGADAGPDGSGGDECAKGEGEDGEAAAAASRARRFREEVPFLDCILEPGDTLYVPIGWWHYVRGLSVSFSVSLWWNGGEG